MSTLDDLFHPVIELPEPVRQARYTRLVGLDEAKTRLRTEAIALADPDRLRRWATEQGLIDLPALDLLVDRAPLFVFAGDVGSGKSALAESFGCDLSTALDVPVQLYRLKLAARGSGMVGEMTTLVGNAFATLHAEGQRARNRRGVNKVLIMVVDEADALTQSRAAQQMHHEDRAGVNAFLAGVDSLAAASLPVLVVLCTNRAGAIDPAVLRRAAAVFEFGRPDDDQRHAVLTDALAGVPLQPGTLEQIVKLTGPRDRRPGFTYSDLTQRLIPAAVLTAFPDAPLTDEVLVSTAAGLQSSAAFAEET